MSNSATQQIESWTALAACARPSHDDDENPDAMFVQGAAQRNARQVCFTCPVRLECLIEALETRMEFGVWGGLTERERRAMQRAAAGAVDWRARVERDAALRDRFERERLRRRAG